MNDFELNVEARSDLGKAATRRLRRQGLVPVILYGGDKEPTNLMLRDNVLRRQLQNEAFYSHILTVKTPDGEVQAVLKDLQRHPATTEVMHVDLLRTSARQVLHMRIPLHFLNEETCPGKKAGGVVGHTMSDVEITCEARNLPEFIALDMAAMEIGDTLHLSDIVMPAGVELTAMMHGDDSQDSAVVSVTAPRVDTDGDEDAVDSGADAAEGDAAEES
jgi:large subunit ribosomal protein L25